MLVARTQGAGSGCAEPHARGANATVTAGRRLTADSGYSRSGAGGIGWPGRGTQSRRFRVRVAVVYRVRVKGASGRRVTVSRSR